MKSTPAILGLIGASLVASPAHAVLIGPNGGSGLSGEYSQFADSPFAAIDFSAGYFYLEDFEGLDHASGQQFNVPGVTGNNGGPVTQTFGASAHDSVDLDDGMLDGNGLAGESWFFGVGSAGVTFSFNAATLGALPSHVGIVWTDGAGSTTFEAFDAGGMSIGTVTANLANGGFFGETDEDRLFGVIDMAGISAIKISNTSGGIEVDHLQFGFASSGGGNMGGGSVPSPATIALIVVGLAGLGMAVRTGRMNHAFNA